MAPPVITQLIVDASGAKTGVAEFEAAMKKAREAADATGLATGSTFDSAMKRWTNSLAQTDPLIKAQVQQKQALAKQEAINTDAVLLGITTQAAAAAQLERVKAKTDEHIQKVREQTGQLSLSEKAFRGLQTATSGVSGQLIALSAGAGPVGVFLSALGPWGVAAAVGIGALAAEINHMIEEAKRMGDSAIEARKFADVTGLTIEQVKALTKTAGDLGVDGDAIRGSIEKFTVALEEARKGTGTLFDKVREINPELALQLALSTSTAQGVDIYAKALKNASSEAQRLALARAGLGRGGLESVLPLVSIADTGGLDAAAEKTKKVTGLTGDWVREVAHLREENIQLEKQTANLMAAIYTLEVLQRQNQFLKVQRDIAAEIAKTGAGLKPNTANAAGTATGAAFGQEPDLAALAAAEHKAAVEQVSLNGHMSEGAMVAQEEAKQLRATTEAVNQYADGADRAAARAKYAADNRDREIKALQLTTNLEKDRLAALGSAATIEEKRLQRINEINVALGLNKIKEEDATRARGAANLDAEIQKQGALIGILGAAATVLDQYRARVQQIAKAQMEGAGATDAQIANAKRLALAQADGTFQLQAQIDASKVQAATVGMTTAKAEEYRIIQSKINENLNAGRPMYDGITDAYRRLAAATGEAKQAEELAVAVDHARFDAKTALLSPLEKEIALLQKRNGINQQTNEIAGLKRQTDAIKQADDAATQFATTLADGLLDGKNGVDALKSAFDGLAKSMANAAIKDAFSGNFEKAGIEAVVAVGAKLASNFFDNSQQKALDEAKLKLAGMTDQILALNVAASGFDASPIVSAIQQIKNSALDLIKAAMAAGDSAKAIEFIVAAVKGINSEVDQFIKPKGDSAGEKIAAANNEAQQIIGELNSLNQQYNLGLNRTTDILAAAAAKVADIQANVTKTLQADINTATGKSWINDLQALVDETKTLQAQASATNTDPTLIARRFDVMAQKIVDGAQLTGDAFNELQSIFPSLTGHVHAYTAAVEDNAAALKKASDDIAKGILDFINEKNVGSDSPLSPTAKLTAAQAQYNSTLALAQGGNVDAQGRITKDADALYKALRENFASGSQFQQGWTQIQQQLLALPAVQTTTDPLLVAMRDTLAAITAGNATQALDATLQNVIKTAIDAGNAQAIAALLVPKFDQLDTTADGALNFSEFVAGLGPSYAALATDTKVAGLLTDSQLRAAGIPVNGPVTDAQLRAAGINVTGPITAGQLATAGLLTGQGLLDAHILTDTQLRAANIPVNGPITDAQLRAAGINVNGPLTDTQLRAVGIGVVGPLTQAQIQTLGLSTEQGNILNVFRELDGNGNGILERSEAVRAATDGVYTAQTWINGNVIATAHAANDTKETVGTGNSILSAIQGLQATAATQLALLNTNLTANQVLHLTVQKGLFSAGLDVGAGPAIDQLRKIVANTYATSVNTAILATNGNGPTAAAIVGTFAQGGIASPGMPIIYGEHHPQGPFFGTVGSSPIAITPAIPSFGGANDNNNSALLARIDTLTKTVEQQGVLIGSLLRQIDSTVRETSEDEIDATDEGNKRVAHAIRSTSRDNKAAA